MVLDEKSEDHQSSYSSSWGEHERLNHISWLSIQQLLRFFSLDQSGRLTDQLTNIAIPRATLPAWLKLHKETRLTKKQD